MAGDLDSANAKLEALRQYFASDELIRDRAAIWRDATPEECLVATAEECETTARLLAMQTDLERERSLAPEPIPEDTLVILERLQRRGP